MIEIVPLQPQQIPEAKQVIYTVVKEYFLPELTLDEMIAHFEGMSELYDVDQMEQEYLNNGGTFLVAVDEGRIIGTGALRRLEDGIGEIKRLWFLADYRGKGHGYRMMLRLFEVAREKGYQILRLSTDRNHQVRAIAFYTRLGFYEIPDYSGDPDPEDLCMEIKLD